jgi:glucokinase
LQVMGAHDLQSLRGVGVASPGPLDTKRGVALGLPTLAGFENYPLAEKLTERLGRRVALSNDGVAAAVGEWKFGAARGVDDFVYVTISTGIGGGVVSGGRILQGHKGMAGHVGHIAIFADGEKCNCGRRGCWEAHAAGPAFEKRAAEKMRYAISAQQIFALAAQGDVLAQALVDDEAKLLGMGIVNLMHAYDPALVVLGGGVANGFAQLRAGIEKVIVETAMPAFRDVALVQAQHISNSGLLGAAALAFEQG